MNWARLASAYVHAEVDVGHRCGDRVKQQSRNKLGHPDTDALADTNAPGRFGTSGHECLADTNAPKRFGKSDTNALADINAPLFAFAMMRIALLGSKPIASASSKNSSDGVCRHLSADPPATAGTPGDEAVQSKRRWWICCSSALAPRDELRA
jgi:hypothetical protein